MYSQDKFYPGLTPVANKLHKLILSRGLPTTVRTSEFHKLCGFDVAPLGWNDAVAQACRDLLSENLISSASLNGDLISFN